MEVSNMNVSIAGLRVLITAGASGIGRVFASTFFDAGAKVFVCDMDTAVLAQFHAAYPEIGVTATDVAVVDQVDAAPRGAGQYIADQRDRALLQEQLSACHVRRC